MDSGNLRDEEAPLVPGNTLKKHTKDVHILSCAFLLIFLAYGAAQNLQSTVNTEHNLGTISLGISYVSFTFFSLFSSTTVRLLGSKNALILGTTGYWLYVAANLTPSWYSMGPAAIYLGFCASIIWVGQGTYLTSAARSHARDSQLNEGRLTSGLSSIAVITHCGAFVQLIVLLWILLSYRFREALSYSTKGYCSIYQGSGCYPAGTVWNWKDCYFLLWNALLGILFKGN